jgi:hypothetical protein
LILQPYFQGVDIENSSGAYTNTQLQNIPNITLNVTGLGNSISGAMYNVGGIYLNASTNDGPITILNTGNKNGFSLGNINAGSGTITLAANTNIYMSPQSYLTAGEINLISTSGNADATSIAVNTQGGVPGQSLLLSAIVTCGALVGDTSTAISINDFSPAGLTIGSLVAQQLGQAATLNNNNVQYNSTPNSTSATSSLGGAGI